jgi:hypothetical protein
LSLLVFQPSYRRKHAFAAPQYTVSQLCLNYSPEDLPTDLSARLAGINVGAPARPLPSADFGLIGLAVMGQNLILNVADHGFTVCAYNRTTSKVDRFLANEAKGEAFTNKTQLWERQVN